MNDGAEESRLAFDREKWAADLAMRTRELDLRQAELELKRREQEQSRWRNPLVVAIFAAAVAAAGNAIVASVNGSAQRELEEGRAESARILEMIKTGDPELAASNLQFLADTGLITDPERLQKLTAFLDTREAGSGPALPPSAGGAIQFEQTKELTQPLQQKLEADLSGYLEYLKKIGLAQNLPEITVRIERMDTPNAYYDPSQKTMVIDERIAPDPYGVRRQITHHALSAASGPCNNPACMSLESGIADYFCASFANDPKVGAISAPVFNLSTPFLRNLENDLPFDPALSGLDIHRLGETWSGAFWEIRAKLGQEAADQVLTDAWFDDSWADDPHNGFVAAVIGAAWNDAAATTIKDIFSRRKFPVEP